MTSDERDRLNYRKANQKYYGLTDEQCDMHMELMGKAISLWPAALQTHYQEQCVAEEPSEENVNYWVAEWLKAGNTLEDPYKNETEEEAEAGRREAIKLLGFDPKDDTPGMDLTDFVKSGEFPDIAKPFPKEVSDLLKKQYEKNKNNKKKW
jgi:hypothetical protein